MALVLVGPALADPAEPATELPSPITGPGHPRLSRSEERRVAKAWRDIQRGRADRAGRRVEGADDNVAVRLLRLQLELLAGGETTGELQGLVATDPGYASAWFTLSVAAERNGHEGIAYEAARLAAELWPDSPWSARRARLEQRWVEAPLEQARRSLAEGAAARSLDELRSALALEPQNHDLVLTECRALIELDRLQDAEQALAKLKDDPAAVMLGGEVAEKQGRWATAMERYELLPEGTPGRAEALERARLQWRLSTLPRYAQAALASPEMTRAQLAALLVNLVPTVETLPGGRVPLLSDIVDTPCQREILACVRLGLIDVDELEHRFDPERPVSPEEVQAAVERLASLLGVQAPRWCDPSSVVSSTCAAVASPVTGEEVSDVVLQVVRGGGQ